MLRFAAFLAVACCASAFSTPSASAEDPPIFVSKWGSSGSEPGQFGSLYSIAVNDSGHVFVIEPGRLQKFNRNGTFLMEWGGVGPGGTGVATSDEGIFIVDENIHVQEFTTTGGFLRDWESPCGQAPPHWNEYYIATDQDNNVYVSHENLNCIRKFTASGVLLASWGANGSGNGQFLGQQGIAVDDDGGHVYVADTGNWRVQKFTSNGDFLGIVGSPGTGDGQFQAPYGVDVDSLGNLFVADTGNDRIQKFAPDGTFLSKWGSEGTGDGQFNGPVAVAVSPDSNDYSVYVADYFNRRIQRFTYGSRVGIPDPKPESRLLAAFPNPTRMGTTIEIHPGGSTPASRVSARVFDATGRHVRTLSDVYVTQSVRVTWDGRTDDGEEVGQGTYFVRVSMNGSHFGVAQVTILR